MKKDLEQKEFKPEDIGYINAAFRGLENKLTNKEDLNEYIPAKSTGDPEKDRRISLWEKAYLSNNNSIPLSTILGWNPQQIDEFMSLNTAFDVQDYAPMVSEQYAKMKKVEKEEEYAAKAIAKEKRVKHNLRLSTGFGYVPKDLQPHDIGFDEDEEYQKALTEIREDKYGSLISNEKAKKILIEEELNNDVVDSAMNGGNWGTRLRAWLGKDLASAKLKVDAQNLLIHGRPMEDFHEKNKEIGAGGWVNPAAYVYYLAGSLWTGLDLIFVPPEKRQARQEKKDEKGMLQVELQRDIMKDQVNVDFGTVLLHDLQEDNPVEFQTVMDLSQGDMALAKAIVLVRDMENETEVKETIDFAHAQIDAMSASMLQPIIDDPASLGDRALHYLEFYSKHLVLGFWTGLNVIGTDDDIDLKHFANDWSSSMDKVKAEVKKVDYSVARLHGLGGTATGAAMDFGIMFFGDPAVWLFTPSIGGRLAGKGGAFASEKYIRGYMNSWVGRKITDEMWSFAIQGVKGQPVTDDVITLNQVFQGFSPENAAKLKRIARDDILRGRADIKSKGIIAPGIKEGRASKEFSDVLINSMLQGDRPFGMYKSYTTLVKWRWRRNGIKDFIENSNKPNQSVFKQMFTEKAVSNRVAVSRPGGQQQLKDIISSIVGGSRISYKKQYAEIAKWQAKVDAIYDDAVKFSTANGAEDIENLMLRMSDLADEIAYLEVLGGKAPRVMTPGIEKPVSEAGYRLRQMIKGDIEFNPSEIKDLIKIEGQLLTEKSLNAVLKNAQDELAKITDASLESQQIAYVQYVQNLVDKAKAGKFHTPKKRKIDPESKVPIGKDEFTFADTTFDQFLMGGDNQKYLAQIMNDSYKLAAIGKKDMKSLQASLDAMHGQFNDIHKLKNLGNLQKEFDNLWQAKNLELKQIAGKLNAQYKNNHKNMLMDAANEVLEDVAIASGWADEALFKGGWRFMQDGYYIKLDKANREIAKKLGISKGTKLTEKHWESLRKMNLSEKIEDAIKITKDKDGNIVGKEFDWDLLKMMAAHQGRFDVSTYLLRGQSRTGQGLAQHTFGVDVGDGYRYHQSLIDDLFSDPNHKYKEILAQVDGDQQKAAKIIFDANYDRSFIQKQVVTGELPVSPLEWVLIDIAADGGKVSKGFAYLQANKIHKAVTKLNAIWALEKVSRPSTAIVAGMDEFMFYNSVFAFSEGWIPSLKNTVKHMGMRPILSKLDKSGFEQGYAKLTPAQQSKYDKYVEKAFRNLQQMPREINKRYLMSQDNMQPLELLRSNDPGFWQYAIQHVNTLLDDRAFRIYATERLKILEGAAVDIPWTEVFYASGKEKITSLPDNHVFVFGSNEAGIHGKGAALDAKKYFGAEGKIGRGKTGRSYALPTKNADIKNLPIEDIQANVSEFVKYAKANPDQTFVVTRVGTGLRGLGDSEVAALFVKSGADKLDNIIVSKKWATSSDDFMKHYGPTKISDFPVTRNPLIDDTYKPIEMNFDMKKGEHIFADEYDDVSTFQLIVDGKRTSTLRTDSYMRANNYQNLKKGNVIKIKNPAKNPPEGQEYIKVMLTKDARRLPDNWADDANEVFKISNKEGWTQEWLRTKGRNNQWQLEYTIDDIPDIALKQGTPGWELAYNSPDLNHLKGHKILSTEGAYPLASSQDAWELMKGWEDFYTFHLGVDEGQALWMELMKAARKRHIGKEAGDYLALPSNKHLGKIAVPGIRQKHGGAHRNMPIVGRDSTLMQQMFGDPAWNRANLMSNKFFANEKARLETLYKSQGKEIRTFNSLGVDDFESIRHTDPMHAQDVFGASEFDDLLWKKGIVTENYLDAKALQYAQTEIDDFMLKFHMANGAADSIRLFAPFGKPWLDFWSRYLKDLGNMNQFRGGMFMPKGNNAFLDSARLGVQNAVNFLPNMRRLGYMSRLSASELGGSVGEEGNISFAPLTFIPNGDTAMFAFNPVSGYFNTQLGALMIEAAHGTKGEQYARGIGELFPATGFAPTWEQWKQSPGEMFVRSLAGGGVAQSVGQGIAHPGWTFIRGGSNPPTIIDDPKLSLKYARSANSYNYENMDFYLDKDINGFDTLNDMNDTINRLGKEALEDAVIKQATKTTGRMLVSVEVDLTVTYADVAKDWIDWAQSVNVYDDAVRDDTRKALNSNPHDEELQIQALNELRKWWFDGRTTPEGRARNLILAHNNPGIYALVTPGYEVTQRGAIHLTDTEGKKFQQGEIFRPGFYDEANLNQYSEYLGLGYIAPVMPQNKVMQIFHDNAKWDIEASEEVYKQIVEVVNQRQKDSLVRKYGEEEAKKIIANKALWERAGYTPVSDTLFNSDDAPKAVKNTAFDLNDLNEESYQLLGLLIDNNPNLGVNINLDANRIRGRYLIDFLYGVKRVTQFSPEYMFTAPAYDTDGEQTVMNGLAKLNGLYKAKILWDPRGDRDSLAALDLFTNKVAAAEQHKINGDKDQFDELILEIQEEFVILNHIVDSVGDFAGNNVVSADAWWDYYIKPSLKIDLDWEAPLPPNTTGDIKTNTMDITDVNGEIVESKFQTVQGKRPSIAFRVNTSTYNVYDGDTFDNIYSSNEKQRIRTIGIMAQEIDVDPNTFPQIYSEATRQKIFLEDLFELYGDRMYIVRDTRFGNKEYRDPYGRMLGWLFIDGGLSGNMAPGTGEYIFFQDHFRPSDSYYSRGEKAGETFRPDYNPERGTNRWRDIWDLDYYTERLELDE